MSKLLEELQADRERIGNQLSVARKKLAKLQSRLRSLEAEAAENEADIRVQIGLHR